ncbi:GNAT family N-acetyltransferase [Streptomyces sp. NPDC001904]|uniref:GNAT family N-acetyltransferase n=1 Tax=Streptomyces sp. NPDC001904 TaxID=3154531 RepID=UPI00331959F1
MLPEPIRTPHLTLLPLAVTHADEMAAVLADPALYTFTGGEPPSAGALRARYARQVAGSPDPATAWLNWVLEETGSERLTGYVQATVADDGTADVAWVVGTPWQGRGFAREAALGMAGWLAAHGTAELVAHVHPRHHASAAVARALGLTACGEDDEGETVWRGPAADPGDRGNH